MDKTTALYFRLLLGLGFQEEYNLYLNTELDKSVLPSELMLQLVLCGSDLNATISILNTYISGDCLDGVDYMELFQRVMRKIYGFWISRKYTDQFIVECIRNIWEDLDERTDAPWNYIEMLWYQEMDMSFTGWSYSDLADDFFDETSEWIKSQK